VAGVSYAPLSSAYRLVYSVYSFFLRQLRPQLRLKRNAAAEKHGKTRQTTIAIKSIDREEAATRQGGRTAQEDIDTAAFVKKRMTYALSLIQPLRATAGAVSIAYVVLDRQTASTLLKRLLTLGKQAPRARPPLFVGGIF